MRTRRWKLFPIAACAGVLLFSCGRGPSGGTNGENRRTIVGGTTDYGHPAVGALTGDHLCSGTLISKKLVLTAAHCFKNDYVYDEFRLGVDALAPDKSFGVSECFEHPDFGYTDIGGVSTPVHDIAICVLATSVTGVAPMPFRTSPLDGQEGAPVTFVGYGMDSGQGTGLGTKRVVTVEIDSINGYGFFNVVDGTPVKNTCTGDSGAPGIVKESGVDRIAGVVSAGDKNCIKNGWNTRVDLHADWIIEMVDKHDPGSVDAGVPQDAAAADSSYPSDVSDLSDASDESDGPADRGQETADGAAPADGAIAEAGTGVDGTEDAGVAPLQDAGPQPDEPAVPPDDEAGGCSCASTGA